MKLHQQQQWQCDASRAFADRAMLRGRFLDGRVLHLEGSALCALSKATAAGSRTSVTFRRFSV